MVKFLEVKIVKEGGILSPSDLSVLGEKIKKVIESHGWGHFWVISGRMPVWAFAYIVHILHPAKGVGVYDPRLGGAVVVSKHTVDVPSEGEIIPLDESEEIEIFV